MGVLTRREDWPAQLAAVVEQAAARPYVLGEWDCLRFCCLAIEEMTGVGFWHRFAGYRTRRQALVTIARIAPSLGEAVSVVLDQAGQSPLLARRGDLLLYRDLLGEHHLGLCIGDRVAVLGPAGLLRLPLTEAGMLQSWRIG